MAEPQEPSRLNKWVTFSFFTAVGIGFTVVGVLVLVKGATDQPGEAVALIIGGIVNLVAAPFIGRAKKEK